MLEAATPPRGPIGDPANVLAILWRGRRLIAASVLTCLALAGAYLATATRRYQATAKLLVLRIGGRPLGVANTDQAHLVGGVEDDIPTHAMIVRSPLVVGRAIELVGRDNLPSLGRRGGSDRAVREAIKNLTVTRPDRLADVLQVDYQARSPEEAIRMVRAITASYKAFLEDVYQKNNGQVIQLMTRARDDLSEELKDQEREYLEFRQETPLLMSDGGGRPLIKRRIDEWDRAANEAMVRAVQLKAQLELGRKLAKERIGLWSISYAMDQMGGGAGGLGPRTQGLTPASPSDYIRQLAQEQQQLADRYGPQNNRVKEIHEQITRVQEQARSSRNQLEQADVNDLLASIEQGLGSIDAMRAKIAEQLDRDSADAKKAEIALLADSNLRNNLERQRTLFNTVVDQLKQAKLTGDFSGVWSQVIEPGNALPGPVRPLVALTLALALAAGGVLGAAAALVAGLLDPCIRSLEELRRVLQLPLLGQVPQLPAALASRTSPAALICQTMPRSPAAEAYKVARANLDLARRGRDVRVVLITSPCGREGKTTVASNLAICLAQAGRRVLLVDADLRHPAQHAIHGLRHERGLVHVLRDLLPVGRVVQATAITNLGVICSGPEVSNPAELLSSTHLHAFLDQARGAYDIVIIDSPSLLAVADPSILGAAADGILLVARASATKRADANRAVEILKGLGTPLLGVLANGIGPESDARAHLPPEPDEGREDRTGGEILADPQITLGAVATGVTSWGYHQGDLRLHNRGMEGQAQ